MEIDVLFFVIPAIDSHSSFGTSSTLINQVYVFYATVKSLNEYTEDTYFW